MCHVCVCALSCAHVRAKKCPCVFPLCCVCSCMHEVCLPFLDPPPPVPRPDQKPAVEGSAQLRQSFGAVPEGVAAEGGCTASTVAPRLWRPAWGFHMNGSSRFPWMCGWVCLRFLAVDLLRVWRWCWGVVGIWVFELLQDCAIHHTAQPAMDCAKGRHLRVAW